MNDTTILDHINPTEREAALIEQYNKALATVASVAGERDRLQAELSAFHAAMERERKPDWEKWHKDLAHRLDSMIPLLSNAFDQPRIFDIGAAARELRYMADSFTLKANFVPAELKIKELEAERDAANRDAKAAIVSLNEASKFATDAITALTHERDSLQVQRDQVLHLLSGGTLTEQQVTESGLGHGVLSEQNHHEAMRCKAEKERDEARAALQQAQADAASMREALAYCKIHQHDGYDESGSHYNTTCRLCVRIDKAANHNSGKAILARLEEARYLLSEVVATNAGWFDHRRDAWLNPKEGE